jgi:hypothetical protein
MRLWDLATGQELRRFEGHSSMIDTVLFSPDERFGVSLAKDGYLVVWDLQTGEAVRRIRVGEPGGGAWAEYSPDGQSVVVRNLIQGTIQEINLWLDPQALLEWTYQNRYVRELTCNERELYRVEPYCDTDDPSKAS